MECNHEIGRRVIGGFLGHEHTHPTGPQLCLKCGKTLDEISIQIRNELLDKMLKVCNETENEGGRVLVKFFKNEK